MTATPRKSMHYARKRAICAARGWVTTDGHMIALERTKACHRRPVTLHDGRPVNFDHVHQLATGGTDTNDNVRPISEAGHKPKTKADNQTRAKIRRITGQNKPKVKAKIQGRGFDKPPPGYNQWGKRT